jgi:menaquinone-specific isochorismate synthase
MKSVTTLPSEEFSTSDSILYELDTTESVPTIWHSRTQTFFRFSAPVDEQSPLDRLQRIAQEHTLYWRDRNGTIEAAGIGIADSLDATTNGSISAILRAIHERTRSAPPNVRYYGGMRFRQGTAHSAPDKYWSAFGEARFVLPFLEYVKENGEYLCHCTIALPLGSSLEEAHSAVHRKLLAFKTALEEADVRASEQSLDHAGEFPRSFQAEHRANVPNKQGWKRSIEEALKEFDKDNLEKVVLARRVTFEYAHRAGPIAASAITLLKKRAVEAQRSTLFLFSFGEKAAFFGATPEYLYKRHGRTIATEAIAGTRRRGADAHEDLVKGNELLSSDKDRREHASVQRYVASGLDELTETFSIGKVELLKLSSLQHLYAPFTGILRNDADDAAIIERLHPTPAVGGLPRREALEFLRREAFDRGWYAAPVGWVNAHAAEFVVAIRSALLTEHHAHLFSGAGIVKGSDPEAEWNEIEMKIAPMLELFATKSA